MKIEPLNPRQWELVEFTDHPDHDTIWTITLGHDGQVYVGLCLEGKGGGVAQVYRYDTQARCLQHLADIGKVTGEPPDSGHATQGKIHFSLCHARDGKLYGATHCTTPPLGEPIWSPIAMWGDPDRSFPGGHLFRYDTLTGEAVDFGVITPHDGIPYLMLDEARRRLYGVTYPRAHFFSTDLCGRDFRDYGRLSNMYPIAMVFDDAGNLYTSDSNSQLIKFDVVQDRLRFLRTKPYVRPFNTDGRFSWITDMRQGPDGCIYGVSYSNDHLFRFDPREDTPVIEDLGPGLPGVAAQSLRCLVPDREGHLYYLVAGAGENGTVLARYDFASGEREPVGRLESGGKPLFTWRGVCGRDGTLYLAGIHRSPMYLLIGRV
ncbi:MAG: hypothetical protein WCP21_06755 [Armatimonadota bacterium]